VNLTKLLDDIEVWKKMKHDLTTGTWQDDTGCPISIILVTTSDGGLTLFYPMPTSTNFVYIFGRCSFCGAGHFY
jgi:hypothetical protein